MDCVGFFVNFGHNICKILDKNLIEIAKGNRDGKLYCLKGSTIVKETLVLNTKVNK